MKERRISENISYIEGVREPLSADIGIVEDGDRRWLFDVGNGDAFIEDLCGRYTVVLSHFHPDHIGNIGKISIEDLYVSKETYRHLPKELDCGRVHIVTEPTDVGSLHIFPIPSSHAKGCLGLQVDGSHAFVGDALCCRSSGKGYTYNAQILENEIEVLKGISAPHLLVSHYKGLVRSKADVIHELEMILEKREKGSPEIPVTVD